MHNQHVVLMMINVLLLVLGCLMDMAPLILIRTPIMLPAVTTLGVDPVHFGMIMLHRSFESELLVEKRVRTRNRAAVGGDRRRFDCRRLVAGANRPPAHDDPPHDAADASSRNGPNHST